ncbi:N-acetylglucosaminyltransferase [Mesoflavibacter sp. HG96]|uniref:glycosyltransferase n=1 Tax=Mesoflavibacter TaxID=444051 RepID=UPI000D110044|nr:MULTISPECIES: glycosyltransferase [Mesoflavibacter]QIJ88576.1 N-acetylglucosaminyltransferase [Mesoflavibacter sp. HG96]QIJ91304.1 N-acetylglucosaminyltransferase [Mesoflavibacter sp. HG37]
MLVIAVIILLLYLFLIGKFAFAIDKVTVFKLNDSPAKTTFTVIIPFRNEAENLPALLNSIAELNYQNSLFEIILVNDDSEDISKEIVSKFMSTSALDITLIENERQSNSPKKDAISSAIKISKYDWIITTDADCVLPKYWLDSLDVFVQQNDVKMVVGPVTYHQVNGFLQHFQLLDFLSLTGSTIAGFGINKPFLCNGANLGYKRSFFNDINGFEGNDTIASGDDIFLMEKALKTDKNSVKYLKSKQATVQTLAQPNFKSLLAQRIRWANKTSNYNNNFAKLVGLLVLLANSVVVIGFVLVALGLFQFKTFTYLFLLKLLIDFLLIYKTSVFFSKEQALKYYLPSSLLYPFFSVYVAVVGSFSTYKWKNRRFKK